ncbi:hypothetical protein GOP47_0023001 [Adiantum capillus-veneris]|uniref:Uncharacterized protein n=1 Tax=Adiantum capillus-veneris TaxID=13818 RepID=A0A9D4U6W7_ADICA|nr:hypothetical protein GOP47_0023001 [Adiantum capillus-veneris]
MAKRIVVFPVKGRRWAFSTVTPPANSACTTSTQASFLQVWLGALRDVKSGKGIVQSLTPLSHYVSDKMEQQWIALGAAKEGSIKNRLHRMGEKLLVQITPSETFLKSMSKDATKLEIVFPQSLNSRLVRRRVRHIAKSGAQIHSRYMYGSFACLPFSILFGIVPVPNAPLFWNLFRAYANWQALQGSRRLMEFVSDGSDLVQSNQKGMEIHNSQQNAIEHTLILSPSKKLESMLQHHEDEVEKVNDLSIARICEHYNLDYLQMLKWRDFEFKKGKKAS